MPRPRGTTVSWQKDIHSLCMFFSVCVFIFQSWISIAHVLAAEMKSLLYLDLSPRYSLMPVAAHGGIWFLCFERGSPVVRDQVGVQLQPLGPSTNTQHPLRLHLIIFVLSYNSADMDSWVEYSGSRQSRAALSCRRGLAEVPSCVNPRQITFFSAVGQNKHCSH